MPVWMLQHFPSQTAKTLIEALAVLQRFAFSLAAVSEKSFETLQNEPIKVTETLARIANGKVLPPASTEPVDLFQRIPQRSFEPAFGECPDFVLESLHRFAGWKEIKISLAASIPVSVIPQGKSEKVQAFAWSSHSYNFRELNLDC